MLFFIATLILLPEVQSQWSFYGGTRRIQCYSCNDCQESFAFSYSQMTITPPDIGQCMKTVVYSQNSGRRLINKGFTRNCVPEFSQYVQIYCCYYDLCNRSNILSSSMIMTIALFLFIYFISCVSM